MTLKANQIYITMQNRVPLFSYLQHEQLNGEDDHILLTSAHSINITPSLFRNVFQGFSFRWKIKKGHPEFMEMLLNQVAVHEIRLQPMA